MAYSIFITGASRGIGAALSEYYARAGCTVLAACRHPENAESLRDLNGIELYQLDVNNEANIASLGAELASRPIDVLVNNAGIMGADYFGQSFGGGGSTEEWSQAFRVNTIAPLRVVEAFMPSLEKGGLKKIINISSIVASMGDPLMGGMYHYRSSKAGLNAVTVGLSMDLLHKGISVASIHPGRVSTDMGERDAPINPQQAAEYIAAIVEGLNTECSGTFFSYDGSQLSW